MTYNGLIQDVRSLFLNEQHPLKSLINFATVFLIAWAINPEAIYYNWFIWSVVAGLWSLLVVLESKTKLIHMVLKQRLWLIAVWPLYTTVLWLLGKGLLHRKFIAVAFMVAVPFYYILADRKKELSALARLGIVILTLVSITTLVQMLTYPDIARDLATGRATGNFRASALLGNFHTVYEAVLLSLGLGGLYLTKQLKIKQWGWTIAFAINLCLVLFAQYDIALISLSLGFVMLVILHFLPTTSSKRADFNGGKKLNKESNELKQSTGSENTQKHSQGEKLGSKRFFSYGELVGTTALYAAPAVALILFRPWVERFITQMDYKTLAISEKLFNRIWVYLRSLFLFNEYPLLGFGVEPNPTEFLTGQHSDYLEILAEYGMIGFLVFLIAWIALLLTMRSFLPKKSQGIFWVGVITFHILFILNPVLEVSSVTMLFLILPGILLEFRETTT